MRGMDTIGQRVKFAREHGPVRMSRTELSKAVGLGYSTLADLENDYASTTVALHRIAKTLRVRVEWLETGKGKMEAPPNSEDEDWRNVPVTQQRFAMGDGSAPEEYADIGQAKFLIESLRHRGIVGHQLEVDFGDGDSMEPRIHSGDMLLIDRSDTRPVNGKIFAVRYKKHHFAKRLRKAGKHWLLESERKGVEPILVEDGEDFEIVGRVRWVGSWED